MIKTRLLHLLGRAKKYVYLQVISQLLSTVIQILIVRNLALLITEGVYRDTDGRVVRGDIVPVGTSVYSALLSPVILFLFLLPVSLKCALILPLAVPLIPIIIMVVMKAARKILDGYFKIYYGLADTFLEKLQGLTILKVFDADEQAARDIAGESENFRKVTMKVLGMQLVSTAVMDIAAYGGTALGFVTALSAFASGEINLYGMVMILFLGAEFFLPMRRLGSYFHIGMNGMKACDKIFAFLDLPEPEDGTESVAEGKTDISIRDLSFSYDKDHPVLKSVSMEIPRGSFVSLVGASGSGKTVLMVSHRASTLAIADSILEVQMTEPAEQKN